MLRGFVEEQHDGVVVTEKSSFLGSNRFLQAAGQECSDMDVVDACRSTGVSSTYLGAFKPYNGDCAGDFLPDLPIYKAGNGNNVLYMYPIEIYGDDNSNADLRGLVRWRIVSFQSFADKKTCRREEANIFQIDFAADGQPYNYYPTIYCFDDKANDFSGYKVSTINIRCNDDVVGPGNSNYEDPAPPPEDSGGDTILVISVTVIVVLVLGTLGYCYFKRQQETSGDAKDAKKKKREAKLEVKRQKEEEAKRQKEEEEERQKKEEEKELKKEETARKESSLTEEPSSDEEKAPTFMKAPEWMSSLNKSFHKKTPEPEKSPVPEPQSLNRSFHKKYSEPEPQSLNKSSHNKSSEPEPRSRSRSRSRRMSVDPPARDSDRNLNDAVPKDIKSMVAYLDNMLDNEVQDISRSRSRSRGRSAERSNANDFANSRGRSAERSKANEFANSRDQPVAERSNATNSRSRSRSAERSNATDFSNSRGRSRSAERSKASDYAARGRSRSAERSKASDYANRGRSRSKERSKADDYANKSRSRSLSKERSKAADFADKSRSRSYREIPTLGNGTIGRSKSGRELDASKANKSVTKNPDGSVLVIAKRTREDGANVTTKTKYANVALARKHGIDV